MRATAFSSSSLPTIGDQKVDSRGLKYQFPIGIMSIFELTPHRSPFLFIENVESFKPFESIVATKCVSINEPFFEGHFPGLPVFPGVLLLETMAQASGILLSLSLSDELALVYGGKSSPLLATIDEARFKNYVSPGDKLTIHSTITTKNIEGRAFNKRATLVSYDATILRDGDVITTAKLSCFAKPGIDQVVSG